MGNQTVLSLFYLSGLSGLQSLQLPLFIFFLPVYLLIFIWNLLIISLIITDTHLHTPMYFFLGNLASVDLCFSSVTIPRMLIDLITKRRMITLAACLTQIFYFLSFAICEIVLLTVMSYDRYVAVCHPLQYLQIMRWQTCVLLASAVWFLGFICSFPHTALALKLTFCKSNIIEGFYCDLPQLLQISCSDVRINIFLIFLVGGFFTFGCLILTFLPYVYIFKSVLKIQVKVNKKKVFSTCSSHLTVVSIFYGTLLFNYFSSGAGSHFSVRKVVSVIYTVVTPLVNPLIYSLRNQDFKRAYQDLFIKKFHNAKYNGLKISFILTPKVVKTIVPSMLCVCRVGACDSQFSLYTMIS
ncbi:olfactory receptor 8D1-like [Gastrophryne carolinensis]